MPPHSVAAADPLVNCGNEFRLRDDSAGLLSQQIPAEPQTTRTIRTEIRTGERGAQ